MSVDPKTRSGILEKKELSRLRLLSRIGSAALRVSDLDLLLGEIARDACRLLGLPRCAIRLFGDPEKVVEHADPSHGPPSSEPGAIRHESGGETPGPILRVPLRIGDEAVGTLSFDLGEGRVRTDEDQATAEAAARQVAMAVRHARLFRDQQEQAGRLLSLMHNVPGLVYRGRPDGKFTFIGAGTEGVTGYEAGEFLDGTVRTRDLIHPNDRMAVARAMRKAVRAGEKVLRVEYRIRSKDGELRWIGDRRQLVYGSRGELLFVDGMALDITERKKADERLRLTQLSVDRAGDAAYWMGPDGRLIYVNDQACRILGYTRDELLSMTVHDINPGFPEDRWAAHWEELRRRGSYTLESAHRAKDGRLIPVEITVNHVAFDGQEYNCVFARDITDRKRAQEESRQLHARLVLAKKIEAVSLLAGGIAHDFNNLLTAILGYSDLLRHTSEAGSDAWKAAGGIRSAAEAASRLTAQLLGFARKGKHLTVPVDLNAAIDGVLRVVGETAGGGISIGTRLHHGPATVPGDPSQLEGALASLAANAVEAMPGGGSLTVSTEPVVLDEAFCRTHPGALPGRFVLVTVADTGVGISRENLGRVFDPFFTTKEPGQGTGLGLSMVYGIVKSHGGYIGVESEVGRGTTFKVFLPQAAPEAVQLEFSYAPAPGPEAERPAGTVLLVDDQEAVREVCGAMLATLGYRVLSAADGIEGLDLYRRSFREIDVVILDMVMPRMGGPECFRGMREVNPDVRAILSTGYSLEGAVQALMEEGVAGFIKKPYRLDQLQQAVARAAGRDPSPTSGGTPPPHPPE